MVGSKFPAKAPEMEGEVNYSDTRTRNYVKNAVKRSQNEGRRRKNKLTQKNIRKGDIVKVNLEKQRQQTGPKTFPSWKGGGKVQP